MGSPDVVFGKRDVMRMARVLEADPSHQIPPRVLLPLWTDAEKRAHTLTGSIDYERVTEFFHVGLLAVVSNSESGKLATMDRDGIEAVRYARTVGQRAMDNAMESAAAGMKLDGSYRRKAREAVRARRFTADGQWLTLEQMARPFRIEEGRFVQLDGPATISEATLERAMKAVELESYDTRRLWMIGRDDEPVLNPTGVLTGGPKDGPGGVDSPYQRNQVEEAVLQLETQRMVSAAVAMLPPGRRGLIQAAYGLEGWPEPLRGARHPERELARMLRLKKTWTHEHLQEAEEALRTIMEAHSGWFTETDQPNMEPEPWMVTVRAIITLFSLEAPWVPAAPWDEQPFYRQRTWRIAGFLAQVAVQKPPLAKVSIGCFISPHTIITVTSYFRHS